MLEKQKQNLKKLSIASKKTRITGEMISIATRQGLQKIGNERLNLSHVASRVDDILGGDEIEDLIHTLQKCGIMLFDEDGIFQLTQQQVQNISFQAPILKKLVEIGLNINNIDQVKYISSVNEEFLQGLMEGDKLKKILRLGVRVSVQVYEGVLKDLLQISKLSLQYVDDFLHNESILKLKKDGYNFTIDSITMVLPTDQEYLVLKKWYDFAKDRGISYDSCICELRKTGLTSDGLDKLHMFFKNNEINLNDYFSKYSINFKTVEILSELDESELKKILSISQKSQELNVFEIINIKSKNPEFIFNGEKNIQELVGSYEKYLASKQVHSVEVEMFQGSHEWKKFVDKMFRLGEYEAVGVIHVPISQGTITREWSGFFMNQTIGNCYLIAAVNAMRRNSHFVQELYQTLKYNKHENFLKSTYGYTFSDGEYLEVSLKELRTEIKKGEKEPEVFLEKILEDNGKRENFIYELLQKIERKGKVTDRGIIELGNIQFPYIDFDKYIIENNGIKKLKFPDELFQEIYTQIIQKKGPYFDLSLLQVEQDRKMKSVDAPLGYKVLEALYAKKYRKTKLGIEGGVASSVMEIFLSQNCWKQLTNQFFGIMGLKSQADKVYMEHILNNLDTGNYIVTTSINKIKGDGNSVYFSYGENDMASGHAYSIVGYDKVKKIVRIVNPWDNNKLIDVPIEAYFRIFDDVSIFEKIDTKKRKL